MEKHSYEEGIYMDTVSLYTYNVKKVRKTYLDDLLEPILLFTVNIKWLLKNIDMSVEDYLNEYTYDDAEYLYDLAKRQRKLLNVEYVYV